jgi:hypothetical protein
MKTSKQIKFGKFLLPFVPEYFASLILFKKQKLKQKCTRAVVLCGFETWRFELREEYWLRILEDRVLIMKFGTKRKIVTGS